MEHWPSACPSSSIHHEPGQLVADEDETARHEQRVGHEGVAQKPAARPPVAEADEDSREREKLADLNTHVEAHDVRDEAVRRERELLQLRREAEAVEQAEDQHGDLRV